MRTISVLAREKISQVICINLNKVVVNVPFYVKILFEGSTETEGKTERSVNGSERVVVPSANNNFTFVHRERNATVCTEMSGDSDINPSFKTNLENVSFSPTWKHFFLKPMKNGNV